MKKIISIVIALGLLICTCGCENLEENINSDFVSEMENLLVENSGFTVNSDEQKPKQEENVNSQKEKTESKKNTSNTVKEESKKETVTKNENIIVNSILPEVKFSVNDNNVWFTDMVNLPNGGFAVAGTKDTYDYILSLIRIYDENAKLQNEYLFGDGNGYEKIACCVNGGFVAASYNPPYLTKISSDFRVEWVKPYEDVTLEGIVDDLEEIYPNCYAVLFSRTPYDNKTLKIAFLDDRGNVTETIELMKNVDISDGDIIPDGKDGFYLVLTCNKELSTKYDLLKANYDSSKGYEVVVMHFNAEKSLTWTKVLGGGGDDWIEEATTDDNGNFYLAVGTNWYGADSFWEMGVERSHPYRRMLVKLDKNGDIVYKLPLSAKGMAVDQVFGIHIKDGKAYVVGMTDYFDGYQIKYPCEQILPEEKQKGERVFCVYNACIDNDGNELDRKIFRCDINNMPCDSALLSNGTLVIAGKVSVDENPFNLEFPSGVDSAAALFKYK